MGRPKQNKAWQLKAKALLMRGYVSEDIAVLLDVQREDVQWLIDCMRDSGMLRQMFPNAGTKVFVK